MRLITIPFSHYCEKARWAADHTGAEYREEAHLPGMHVVPARRAGGRTVPILVDGRASYTDSRDILHMLDGRAKGRGGARLYPDDAAARREVEAIEATCDEALGPAARTWVYRQLIDRRDVLTRAVGKTLSPMERAALRVLLRLIAPRIRAQYDVNPEGGERARATLVRVFDEMSRRLGERRYLVGDRFTAADLTFASLAAPVVPPEGHPVLDTSIDGLPAPFVELTNALRATAAGAHVARIYREHRGARARF